MMIVSCRMTAHAAATAAAIAARDVQVAAGMGDVMHAILASVKTVDLFIMIIDCMCTCCAASHGRPPLHMRARRTSASLL